MAQFTTFGHFLLSPSRMSMSFFCLLLFRPHKPAKKISKVIPQLLPLNPISLNGVKAPKTNRHNRNTYLTASFHPTSLKLDMQLIQTPSYIAQSL